MASPHRAPSIPWPRAAPRLAAETGLDATFVVSDVAELPANLEGRDFDVVFTSFGALNWLPDLTPLGREGPTPTRTPP
jgi:hypothetical protein